MTREANVLLEVYRRGPFLGRRSTSSGSLPECAWCHVFQVNPLEQVVHEEDCVWPLIADAVEPREADLARQVLAYVARHDPVGDREVIGLAGDLAEIVLDRWRRGNE